MIPHTTEEQEKALTQLKSETANSISKFEKVKATQKHIFEYMYERLPTEEDKKHIDDLVNKQLSIIQ